MMKLEVRAVSSAAVCGFRKRQQTRLDIVLGRVNACNELTFSRNGLWRQKKGIVGD